MSGNVKGIRLAIAGRPVMHSRSPVIFRKLFSAADIEGFYSRIAADTGEEAFSTAGLAKLNGFNVTSPFKNEAAVYSVVREDAVEKLNAANTIVIDKESGLSRISAYNTDYKGVSDSVKKRAPELFNPDRRTAFVAGAGGAGLAAAYGLARSGFNVTVFSRTPAKTLSVINTINSCSADFLDNLAGRIKEADLFVNAMPVSDIFFNPADLKSEAVLFDADYKNRPLEKAAHENRIKYISGFDWLISQAEYAFKIFTGMDAGAGSKAGGVIEQEDLVYNTFSSVALIGFMGSGKTAAGYRLAEITGKKFIDIDNEIEKAESLKIGNIFESRGEKYFRSAEKRILETVLERERNCIISCGGGAVIDSASRILLREKTLTVWLVCSPEITLERIKDKSRPLLNTGDRIEAVQRIFNDRIDFYGETSELIINSGIRNIRELAGRIHEEISYAVTN